MLINLIADNSVSSAPSGFTAAIQAAANIFDSVFSDNITVNIRYGWGTFDNSVDSNLTNDTGAEGGPIGGNFSVSYSTLKSWLSTSASALPGGYQATAVGNLPASNSAFPNSANSFFVSNAQEKALGHFSGSASAIDGAIGFGTASSPEFWEEAALHEIAHALGRTTNFYEGGVPTIMDLFRYNSTSHFQWTGGQPAYLSINGGQTDLANFSTISDYGDFAVDALTPSDPFDFELDGSVTTLTGLDVEVMDALGFHSAAPVFGNDNPISIQSGATATITRQFLSATSPTNVFSDSALVYTAVTSPSDGVLLKNGVATTSFTQDDIDNNRITYHETASNVTSDLFTFNVSDPAGNHTANAPFRFQITPLPDTTAPVFVNDNPLSVAVGATAAITSSLLQVNDPDNTDAQLTYTVVTAPSDGTLLKNGVATSSFTQDDIDNDRITYDETANNVTSDSFVFNVSDPTGNHTANTPFQFQINTPPGISFPTQSVSAAVGQSLAASTLFSGSDSDGDQITQYDVWSTDGVGHWMLGSQTLAAGQDNFVNALQLGQLTYQVGAGTDTLWVRANDGTQWGSWRQFTVTASAVVNTPPVITFPTQSVSATAGQGLAASNLFSASDSDGDQITQYDVWSTDGVGHWMLGSQTLAAGQDNFVNALQLGQLSYQVGAGTDTLWVRANDGTQWGSWRQFTVSAATANTAPAISFPSQSVSATAGQSLAASNLFSASDSDGDQIAQYDVWSTDGVGHWMLGSQTLAAGQDNFVNASQLGQLSYQAGAGADTLWVRANDGTQWGSWRQFTVSAATANTAPAISFPTQGVSATTGQSLAASNLFSAIDSDGDQIAQYDVWSTDGVGHWVLGNQTLAAGQDNLVNALQLGQLTYQVGAGTDTLWVRANDGTQWGAWRQFTVSAPAANTPPQISFPTQSVSATVGQSLAASSLFSASDSDGDQIAQYDVWSTDGVGHWMLGNQTLAAGQDNFVSASQLGQLSYQVGAGTDTLWVRANDGSQWGDWRQFTVSAANTAAGDITTPAGVIAPQAQSGATTPLHLTNDPSLVDQIVNDLVAFYSTPQSDHTIGMANNTASSGYPSGNGGLSESLVNVSSELVNASDNGNHAALFLATAIETSALLVRN